MFDDLQVSEIFKNQITSAIKNTRLSHALILEGGNETTRLLAAKEIACALVCKAENKPCYVCEGCKKAMSDIHPDIHLIKKDEGAMIKVDEIRDFRSATFVLPNESDKSVFIISQAQNMNPQSQNALLKILEEPKPYVNFILTCPSKSALLTTVISRATSYSVGQSDENAENEKLQKAKALANELLSVYISENELNFIKVTAVFNKDKSLFNFTLKAMLPIIRDCIVYQNSGKDLLCEYPDTAKKLSMALTAKKTIALYEAVSSLSCDSQGFSNHNLTLTRLPSILYDIKSR